MMKNKLDAILPAAKIIHSEYSDSKIYVTDYTNRTNSERDIAVFNTNPDNMDVLVLKNDTRLNITASIFGKQCFMDAQNNEIRHCECVLYPTITNSNTWILFVEIKDCKPKNIASYIKSAKEQIIRTVELFRELNLLEKQKKVHAVITFPQKKTNFYHHIIAPSESQKFLHQHKIIIRATNILSIKNDRSIA
jgi:hypothetical protein